MTFFELKTPMDLFRKLEGDLVALEMSCSDSRAAFNFFVTAEHLPDWLKKRPLVREHAILRVVSHLANGAKHFEVSDKRHRSILATETDRYVEEGYNAPGYFEEPLIINLAPDEERELGASVIDVLALGRMVLDFWRPHVATA